MSSPSTSQGATQHPVPSNWRKPTFDINRGSQLSQARTALEKNIRNTNTTSLEPILAYQLAEFDQLSSAPSQYNSTVINVLTALKEQSPGFANDLVRSSNPIPYCLLKCYFAIGSLHTVSIHPDEVSEAFSLLIRSNGYAAIKAYMAYGDSKYLELAKEAWETANGYTISPLQAQMGSIPGKNFRLNDSCGGAPLVGGTFYQTGEGDKLLNTIASGLFLMVSGLLGNATGDSTYLDAASSSLQFLITQLYNHITNEAMGGVNSATCEVMSSAGLIDAALLLEGAAILGDVTRNETTKAFMSNLALNSIKKVASDNSQGIIQGSRKNHIGKLNQSSLLDLGANILCPIQPADEQYGGHFIRALTTVYDINTTDEALRDYIRAFIAVQYNAVVDLAGNKDTYAGLWSGPAAAYDFSNQTTAIEVLLSGLAVGNITDSQSARPPPPTNTSMPTHHKSIVGAIVGGAIGGSIVLLLMLMLLVLILRQRRRIAVSATLPKPFEEPSQGSIQSTDHDVQQIRRVKHPMPALGPSTNLAHSDDRTLEETRQVIRDHAEAQGITIGSLVWELNELLRWRNRATEEESPPVYSTAA